MCHWLLAQKRIKCNHNLYADYIKTMALLSKNEKIANDSAK